MNNKNMLQGFVAKIIKELNDMAPGIGVSKMQLNGAVFYSKKYFKLRLRDTEHKMLPHKITVQDKIIRVEELDEVLISMIGNDLLFFKENRYYISNNQNLNISAEDLSNSLKAVTYFSVSILSAYTDKELENNMLNGSDILSDGTFKYNEEEIRIDNFIKQFPNVYKECPF